jgi:chromosome segregation ATPase
MNTKLLIIFGTSYTEPILQENNDVFWVVRSEIITITEEDSNIVFNYIESQTNPIDFNNISGTISTALEQRLGTMQEDISSAQEDITSIQGSNSDSLSTVNLNTLDRRVTSVSSTVNNLMSNAPANTTIKSLSDKISSLESASTTLRNDVNSASSTANSNATQITNLTSRVTAE